MNKIGNMKIFNVEMFTKFIIFLNSFFNKSNDILFFRIIDPFWAWKPWLFKFIKLWVILVFLNILNYYININLISIFTIDYSFTIIRFWFIYFIVFGIFVKNYYVKHSSDWNWTYNFTVKFFFLKWFDSWN